MEFYKNFGGLNIRIINPCWFFVGSGSKVARKVKNSRVRD